MTTVIKNGHVIDPASGLSENLDVLFDDATITKIGKDLADTLTTPGLQQADLETKLSGFVQQQQLDVQRARQVGVAQQAAGARRLAAGQEDGRALGVLGQVGLQDAADSVAQVRLWTIRSTDSRSVLSSRSGKIPNRTARIRSTDPIRASVPFNGVSASSCGPRYSDPRNTR